MPPACFPWPRTPATTPNFGIASAVYWETQADYLAWPATCSGSGTATSSSRCGGGRYSYSFVMDYRPLPRLSVYAGVLVSNVYGGVASGYLHAQNIAPTAGVRFQF